jgi:hypothetical protein
MTKRSFPRKQLVISLAVLAMAIIAGAIFRYNNPSVGFTYFEPAYLPAGTSIKAKRIDISKGYTSVDQNFRTEDWVYGIVEHRVDDTGSIDAASQNYDPESVEPTCSFSTTPAHMRYRLCHWVDYGRIDVHEVIFIKGNTYIYSEIPTGTDQTISVEQVEKYIDSFQQKSTLGLPVLRSAGP